MNNLKLMVEEAVKKAHDCQDKYNALTAFADVEQQLADHQDGLLNIPIILKDNVSTKGLTTTASCNILANYVPVFDATIVKKLKDAGCINIAKSALDELAMGGYSTTPCTGAVLNPWDVTRTAGGSSGGSAVSVAAGVVPFAIGSDTGDSIRKPAAYCGIIGVKPTYGRISRYGIIPYASSLDHVGYFTRNVALATKGLEALAGYDPKDCTSSKHEVLPYHEALNQDNRGKKLVVIKNVISKINNQETLTQFNHLVAGLKAKGIIVEEKQLDEKLLRALLPTYYMISNCEATANHSNLDGVRFGVQKEGSSLEEIMINSRTAGFGLQVKKRFILGSYGLAEENQEKLLRKAQKVRRKVYEMVEEIFATYDGILVPACNGVAPKFSDLDKDELSDDLLVVENYMVMANFTGTPSMTLPLGFDHDLPLGVNLTCKAFNEYDMFALAKDIEEITGLKDIVAEGK